MTFLNKQRCESGSESKIATAKYSGFYKMRAHNRESTLHKVSTYTWTSTTPQNSKSQKAKTEMYSLIIGNLSDEWQRLLVKSFGEFLAFG